ncbi:MAG: HEAT repeat domain-containing protein [Planctomycetota bacterium]|nr:HEAT repeat domain-containing protein [Planctomycetota bacterium]
MSWAHEFTDGWQCEQLTRNLADDKPKKKWKDFQPKGTPPMYSRDRVVDVRHIKIEVALDVKKKSVAGVARLTMRPFTDDVTSVELDAVELNVARVECDGRALSFDNTGEMLIVRFPRPLLPERDATVSVTYAATPRRGLYFVGPDKFNPKKHREVWSQGQDEDNRHWFPCFDYPNEKATSELVATVPGSWFCLSNGKMLSRRKNRDGTATFHWKQEVPHVSYLITLCAGEFSESTGAWSGIPVNYYVPPGREADGERSFGRTPEMVKFYSELIGVRYPYAKYAQITAADFIFGGMENTSATTQTERTLHDARAHLDFSSEPLVAHELVHSWFGNLLTCRDWSHAWLNESFATYFDNLWYRHARGEDEFRYEQYGDLRAYLGEDASSYRRPIMTNVYRAPIDMFDRHLYQKGGCVLNMLRNILGDRLFFKAIQLYTERHRAQTVVTQDLLEALEDATGRNFDWLFEQWIFKGGHPEFEVACAWDEKHASAALTVKQTQTPDELTSIFRLPLKVRFVGKGYDETKAFELREASHTFHLSLPARPSWIGFDPANSIPKTLDLKFDEDQLAAQLREDDDVMGRVYAAQALGKKGTNGAVEALGEALLKDKFWGVQAECAAALAKIHTTSALEKVLAAAKVKHPKARRAVARALGEWTDAKAANALLPLARKDASYYVEAEAAQALGKAKGLRARAELLRSTRKASYLECIRAGALTGLTDLDAAQALPELEKFAKVGQPEHARNAALGLLGKAARDSNDEKAKARVRETLERALLDGFFLDRFAAMRGLKDLRDPAAISALTKFKDSALDQRLARHAESTIAALRDAGGVPPEVKALREELEKLKKDAQAVKEKLEKVSAQTGKRGKR